MAEVSFGEWLKRQRKAAGLTQEQLALQISCSTSALKKIEGEERRPSAQIVEQLAEIFNIPPTEQTAFHRFARGDWRSSPSQSIEDPPWRASTVSPRSNLPSSLTSLIGREQALSNLGEYLSNPSVRLVTLIGPPGIGKTSLSLQVARQALSDFANGVFFVALAPLEDPGLVAPTIAQTLGFVETPNQSPTERLKNGIGDKQILIVLDNVEHLIDGAATLVSDILSACSRLKILTTSREALRVPGEWLYFVSPLNMPEGLSVIDVEAISEFSALTLFAERARAVRPDFALNAENIQTVAAICTQLDGLPLAIELIAARIRWMSPGSLLSHMTDQFVLSADGMRAVSARQKTLQNAIGWSYDLLPAKEQALFRRLGAFTGGWTLEDAQAVCAGAGIEAYEISDLLTHLVDKSLVVVREEQGMARYHMLETIHQYAQEKLVELHEEGRVRNRHLDFFMKLAEDSEPKLHGAEQSVWLERLEGEMNNFRTALRWAFEKKAEAGFRLASALWLFWHMHNHFIEGRQWYDEALSISTGALPLIRIRLLNGAASMAMARSDIERTAAFSEQCLALSQEQENKWGLALSLHHLGLAAMWQGDYKRAQNLLEEGLVLSRKIGNWAIINYLLGDLGTLAGTQGNFEQARAYYEEFLALARKHADKWLNSFALQFLAILAYRQGNYSRARTYSEEALTLDNKSGDKRLLCSLLEIIGRVAFHQGKSERAARLISAVEALNESIGILYDPDIPEEPNIVVTIREQLGAAIFEALSVEGRAMTMEQAIAYALEESN